MDYNIYIDGEIGLRTTPENVRSQIENIPESTEAVIVNIHSPGGAVFEGRQIASMIKNLGKKTIAQIQSYCGSIATKIALSCDEVMIEPDARFMIHNASVGVEGNKEDLGSAISELAKIDKELSRDYQSKTQLPESQISEWMKEEKMFTGTEAVEAGFADKLISPLKAVAKFDIENMEKEVKQEDVSAFKTMLDGFLAKFKEIAPKAMEEPQNMEVKLSDGTTIYVDSNDGSLEGKPALIMGEDGEQSPAPDGGYTLEDGKIITIENGVITTVSEPEQKDEEKEKMKEEIEALKAQLGEKEKALAEATAKGEETQKAISDMGEELTELKNQFKNLKLGSFENEKPVAGSGNLKDVPTESNFGGLLESIKNKF